MKFPLKSLLLFIVLFTFIKGKTQAQVNPLTDPSILYFKLPNGVTYACGATSFDPNNFEPICTATICLGDAICLSYYHSFAGYTTFNYIQNHNTIQFSDGQNIQIEHVNYTGSDATGCVNYIPTTTGVFNLIPGGIFGNIPFQITVLPSAPPVLSANITPANPICVGQQVCAQSLTQNNQPIINYSFSSTTNIPCVNPVNCGTPNTTAFCFPPGSHQIRYTVNAGNTCSNTAVYPITVIEPRYSLTVIPPTFQTCNPEYCFNITSIPNNCILTNNSYIWQIVSSNGSTNIQVTNNNAYYCTILQPGTYNISVFVNDAQTPLTALLVVPAPDQCVCYDCNPVGLNGLISNNLPPNEKYCINNNISISGNVTFKDSEFKVNPNLVITVNNGAVLTIDHCRFFGSNTMWSGIKVQNGGRVNVINNSLIEDALVAIDINNNTSPLLVLNVTNSIFNKNGIGIRITNYNPSFFFPFSLPSAFIVTNTLFTSRIITDCGKFLAWPNTSIVKAANNPTNSILATPYINNANYPVTNLIAPLTGRKPNAGILLENCGVTFISGNFNLYNQISIGNSGGNNQYNLFDNHWIGIDANNSNVQITNSIFQNGWNPSLPVLYSCGVRAQILPNQIANKRVIVSSANFNNNNKFYNLHRAVRIENFYEATVENCEMYNTRIYVLGPVTQNNLYGISMQSNRYNLLNFNNNKIHNIDNAIDFKATIGLYNVGGNSGNGQFLGSINVNNNQIRGNENGTQINPFLHYGYKAISISTILGNAAFVPGNNEYVRTNNNLIFYYENGISCNNFPLHNVTSENNTITIKNSTNNVQYGIEHNNNKKPNTIFNDRFSWPGIISNNVRSLTINNNPNSFGIRASQNTAAAVRCNTVANTFYGIAYSGTAIQGSYFVYNIFNGNNRYGFALLNSGVIGQQGAPNVGPTDNRWIGNSWTGQNFKTATINSTAQNSILFIRPNNGEFNPNGSGFTNGTQGVVTSYYYSGNTGTLRAGNFAPYIGCGYSRPLALSNDFLNYLEQIALNQSPFGTTQTPARFVAKTQLFDFLKINSTFINQSNVLNNFYNSNLNNYRDLFKSIEEDVALIDYNSASSKVNGFQPQNISEDKHKLFMTYILKYQNQTIDDNDKQGLFELANGCPSVDGAFIHQARTLYNVAFDYNINFIDSCDYTISANGAKLSTFNEEQIDELLEYDVFIYPNPIIDGQVYVRSTYNESENLLIEVSNVNGAIVLSQTITSNDYEAKIKLDVKPGIYFIKVINTQNKQSVIKKLVIQ